MGLLHFWIIIFHNGDSLCFFVERYSLGVQEEKTIAYRQEMEKDIMGGKLSFADADIHNYNQDTILYTWRKQKNLFQIRNNEENF